MAPPGSNADGASAAAAVVVCCMCGDHGLPGELFRCGLCLHRLQHRYCSNLYPRVAAYRTCNWCLRDDEGGGGSPVKAPPPTTTAKQRAPSRLTDSRDHIHGGGGGGGVDDDRPCGGSGGCSRSAFSPGLGKGVKKSKKSNEGPAALRSVTTTTAATRRKPPSRAKVRVQRYKLLADVIISC